MANLPRVSRERLEVIATGGSPVRISQTAIEVISAGTDAPRVMRAQLEAVVLFNGPILEPGGAQSRAVWVALGA